MPREPRPGLLLTLVSVFVGLCESGGAASGAPQQHPSTQHHPVCRDGLEFWSAERGTCLPCTRCAPEITLSPCAVHKDAICGPLSALEIDWSFLSRAVRKRPPSPPPPSPANASDDVQRRLEVATSKLLWQFPEEGRATERLPESGDLANLSRGDDGSSADGEPVSALQQSKTAHDPRERRKSGIEDSLSWDWQTGALILAVCACIVFFLVAGCSALVYARQWRRMKRNFEPAGLEEISASLNLIVKADLAELIAGAPMNSGDPETRCQYLEKLLDRKRETPVVAAASATAAATAGNLYIEEGDVTTPRSNRSQISQIQHNIETMILSQKSNQVVD